MKWKRKLSLVVSMLIIFLTVLKCASWIKVFVSISSSSTLQSLDQFNPSKHLLVFFHIEKTSGTNFDREIVQHLLIQNKNDKEWCKTCVKRDLRHVAAHNIKSIASYGVGDKYACRMGIKKETWYLSRVKFQFFVGYKFNRKRIKWISFDQVNSY